jgi:hypothetical protein
VLRLGGSLRFNLRGTPLRNGEGQGLRLLPQLLGILFSSLQHNMITGITDQFVYSVQIPCRPVATGRQLIQHFKNPMLHRKQYQPGGIVATRFSQQVVAVAIYGTYTDKEFFGYFGIAVLLANKQQHFPFPLG